MLALQPPPAAAAYGSAVLPSPRLLPNPLALPSALPNPLALPSARAPKSNRHWRREGAATVPSPAMLVPQSRPRSRLLLPLALALLLALCLHACAATEQRGNDQQDEDMEAALADVDAALPASSQAARELEENAWLRPQTEWREQVSAETHP